MSEKSKPGCVFSPRPFGPAYQWIDRDSIKIEQGEFANGIFNIDKQETSEQVQMTFYHKGQKIGHCFAEFIKNSMIVIWDVVLEHVYQHKGLAEMMVKLLTKELLARQKTTHFEIRMLRLFKPEESELKLQNIGMGVIAYKLGLTCEYDIEQLIKGNNILSIEVIAPSETIAPAYKIVTESLPYTAIAFMIDIEKEKPISNYDTYLKYRRFNELLFDLAKHRALIVGNANYLLKDNGIRDFVNRLADNEDEAKLIYQKIQGIK
jgi:hypothetical protein